MIRHLRGEYLSYDKGAIVLETSAGIGFRIFVADCSPILNAREGDELEIYTYMQVKEDGMSLYGFNDLDGLRLFEMLITVNGVGPKAGLAIMSLGTPNQIKGIIAAGDSLSISKAQGVGKKTAERVILELSEKVNVLPFDGVNLGDTVAPTQVISGEKAEALMALTTLGYTKKEAEAALSHVEDTDITAEQYIKKALKYLL